MKHSAKPLSVVIPVYNLWEITGQCLESLRKHTPGSFFEVVVVDNGSSDLTPARCPELGRGLFGGSFKYVRLDENQGFGPACNLGAEQARGQRIFFLNNDTLLSPGWFGPLLKAMDRDSGLGAVGPVLLYPGSERVQHIGIAMDPVLHPEHVYEHFPGDHPVVGRRRRLQAVTGAAMLMDRGLFFDLGGFCPGYRNGCEDLDLCCLIRDRGLGLEVVPDSRIYHLASQTPGRFRHDPHNFALLNERCRGKFRSDLHRFLAQDGYEVCLTPWLVPYAALPEHRAKEVAARAGAFSPDGYWRAINEEPLWEPGYEALAGFFEQAGAWSEAAELRFLQAALFPSRRAYLSLALAAGRAGAEDLVKDAAGELEKIARLTASPAGLAAKARDQVRWAENTDEPALASLYRDWLARHVPEQTGRAASG